jgi:hypothetical protein
MSGTGKSSVIQALSEQGHKAIDTDWNPDWETPPRPGDPDADGPGWTWREDRIDELLSAEDADVLFVSACVPNQSRFYSRLDSIVLLSASTELTMLRRGATHEIDTDMPLGDLVARILEIAGC